jgi:hypothetical protein
MPASPVAPLPVVSLAVARSRSHALAGPESRLLLGMALVAGDVQAGVAWRAERVS